MTQNPGHIASDTNSNLILVEGVAYGLQHRHVNIKPRKLILQELGKDEANK
jgi:hypothetical protein